VRNGIIRDTSERPLSGGPRGNISYRHMKTFACYCGNRLHFENTRCLACGRRVAFLHEELVVAALEEEACGRFRPLLPQHRGWIYRRCRNDSDQGVCNWMVREDDSSAYCVSCRLNRVIPDLSSARNLRLWHRVECAKRRLLYTVLRLRLPFVGRDRDPQRGLGFMFLVDPGSSLEFADDAPPRDRILTGHEGGLITINLAEADDSARERMRERMNEAYRTLLGHFRHEIGHYFWDVLVRDDGERLGEFRALFGDELGDYSTALARYYAEGPPADWSESWISAYAASHPWEDWAETWAHYLHMSDTLETAEDFGFSIRGHALQAPVARPSVHDAYAPAPGGEEFTSQLADWARLTEAINAINRSMGLPDAYPFALNRGPARKLAFVHALIGCARESK